MSVPPRLLSKLNETLGLDSAGDLVNWLDQMRADSEANRQAMRADFAELRQEMRAMEARLKAEFHNELHSTEKSLIASIHIVDNKIDSKFAELLRWSFVFWVGAVAAIAMLANVLSR